MPFLYVKEFPRACVRLLPPEQRHDRIPIGSGMHQRRMPSVRDQLFLQHLEGMAQAAIGLDMGFQEVMVGTQHMMEAVIVFQRGLPRKSFFQQVGQDLFKRISPMKEGIVMVAHE